MKHIHIGMSCLEHPDLVDAGWEATQLYIWLWLLNAEHSLSGIFFGGHATPKWIARQCRIPPKLSSGQTAEEWIAAGIERLIASGAIKRGDGEFLLTWPDSNPANELADDFK